MLVEKGEEEVCRAVSVAARDDSTAEAEAFDLDGLEVEEAREEEGGGRAAEMEREEGGAG